MGNMQPLRKKDLNTTAFNIVQAVTGLSIQVNRTEKDSTAVKMGEKGGLKGGKARAEKLTEIKRKEIARKAALARWGKVK